MTQDSPNIPSGGLIESSVKEIKNVNNHEVDDEIFMTMKTTPKRT